MRMKFSIIIPIYNKKRFVHKCLDSVLQQVEDDWECICIDDGSTDGSSEIVDRYVNAVDKDNYKKFKVIHQANAGSSCARNNGIGVATGDIITFLDADDYLDPLYLTWAKNVFDQNDQVDVVCCAPLLVGCNGNALPVSRQLDNNRMCILSNSVLETIYKMKERWWVLAVGGKFFRKDFILKYQLKFRNGLWASEDSLFLAQSYSVANNAVIDLSFRGYMYRQGAPSQSRSQTELVRICEYELIDDCLQFKKNHCNSDISITIRRAALSMMARCITISDYGIAKQYSSKLVLDKRFKSLLVYSLIKHSKWAALAVLVYVLPRRLILFVINLILIIKKFI